MLFLLVATTASAAATIHVTTTGDPDDGVGDCATTDHSCSLREAINAANQASGDTVLVPAGRYKLTQPAGHLLDVTGDMTLAGSGAGSTTIEQTVAGINVLNVGASATVTIDGVTLTGGHALGSEADPAGAQGGGILSAGTLTLRDSMVSGNEAEGYSFPCLAACGGGTVYEPGMGGGIDSTGPLRIINSTVSGNTAQSGAGAGAYGAGIYSSSKLIAVNSTIAGNAGLGGSGAGLGGGIFQAGGTLKLANVTLVRNTVDGTAGSTTSKGGNLYLWGSIHSSVKNSLIAMGAAGAGNNCAGGTLTSAGYNLTDQDNCGLAKPSDVHSANAGIRTLSYVGGQTDTVGLQSDSPAINGGNPHGCADASGRQIRTDERGVPRPQGARCDIGAFEFRTVTVTGRPKISGRAQVGRKLVCQLPMVQSPDGGARNDVIWLRGAAGVATGPTYRVRPADTGRSLRCRLRAANAAGVATRNSSPVSIPPAPKVKITSSHVSGHKAKFGFETRHAAGARCALAKLHKQPRYSSCTSPAVYGGLAKGRYTFFVRAVGPGGTSAPAKHAFKVVA